MMNGSEMVPIEAVSWEQLQQYVYEVDGSWRDIYVLDATRDDWKTWADFVNANYRVAAFTDGDAIQLDQLDFAAVEHLWDSQGQANMLTASFFVGGIDVKCHFFSDTEIENDIDPSKIDSYAVHLQLLDYMSRLSHALGKEVVLTGENDSPGRTVGNWAWAPLISATGDQIRVNPIWLDPRSR